MVVMMIMTTRCHGAKEKTRMAAFTVLSTSLSLLSVITRDVPGGDTEDNDGDIGDDTDDADDDMHLGVEQWCL